ncbi:DNA polymerase delta subunit 3 [Morus notabilis]|uniref:DNA polymerase delta subunit 3 n=1 Tax=Morus notabilis TaxID=981085 RepID=W9RRS0_9ROSA|nr:uncharacterized protein LOC21384550 isoform X1 [Morus notabilis]EXC05378.1 DNA polymerase delta subunit 3 [Morus notabilis]
MAQIETLGILQDIESLVSDRLQVVSYKWLSRNYLLSSNSAKRLLQEFVEKHGNGFEVVYALSGWLKGDSPSYHIRLVTGTKLEEAKQEFDGSCSVQVYSVQACIPKDPAVLWNVEFVQAEELFKQPSTIDNCLRDNRFCAISNSFIKRNVEGTPSSVSAAQFQSGVGVGLSKSGLTSQKIAAPQSLQQKGEKYSSKVGFPSPNLVKDVKSENTGLQDPVNQAPTNKEKVPSMAANKKKVQNGKGSSGTEGSLANFWSRASAKTKASCPAETSSGASAEAQICAREAVNVEGASSDDDGQDKNFKRASNGESTRKRRVVLYFSDDDEYENAVSLSSPEAGPDPKGKESINSLVPEKSNAKLDKREDDKSEVKEKVTIDKGSTKLMKNDASAIINDKITGTSPKEKALCSVQENDVNKRDKLTKTTPESPKRRKVLKTQIDERGREVTEVIWEGEDTEAKKATNGTEEKADSNTRKKIESNTSTNNINRPPAAKKSPAVGNTAPSNPTGKAGNKKTGNKDSKQGNILSFFKRV